MQNWKKQKHSSDPKTSKIRTMFLEMQNSSLGGRFGFLLTKLIQFCHTFYQLFNQFFADFEYHTRVTDQICAYLRKISGLVSICCHLNIREAVCLSICLFEVIKVSWPPKFTIECLCVICKNRNTLRLNELQHHNFICWSKMILVHEEATCWHRGHVLCALRQLALWLKPFP